jgi:hypothetical protein
MGKSPPSAPDPYQSAAAQYQYGTQAAAYNTALDRPNSVTPYGTNSYAITGHDPQTGAPLYTQTTALNPTEQSILTEQQKGELGLQNTAQGLLPQVQSSLSSPTPTSNVQSGINTSGVSAIPGAGDLSGFTHQAQDAAYKQQTQYLDPEFQQGQEQLDAQLRNSGAHPGDPAYDNAMKLFTNQKQQAYSNAEEQSVQQGLAEQQALYGEGANTNAQQFGEAASAGSFSNQADAQKLAEQLQIRGLPLTEYGALTGSAPVQTPQGSGAPAGNTAAPDIMSAFNNQYQGQLAGYNANVQSTDTAIGSLATVGTIAAYLI